jgi:hypothetical protein
MRSPRRRRPSRCVPRLAPTRALGFAPAARARRRARRARPPPPALAHPPSSRLPAQPSPPDGPRLDVGIAPGVLKALADAEAARGAAAGDDPAAARRVEDSIGRIVETARKLSEGRADASAGEQAMRSEFESLLSALATPRGMDPAEVKRLKDEVFGPQTFWVTSTAPAPGAEGGLLVRGNLRAAPGVAFDAVCERVERAFGAGAYVVRLVELAEGDGSMMELPEPRPTFLILPAAAAAPEAAPGWARGAAAVLAVLTLGAAAQLGLAACVGLLPRETLAWLADPENLAAAGDALPPGLDAIDPLPFLRSAAAVGGAALLPQLAHELGHAAAAAAAGLKLGPTFLIPNGQLATFGSITQLKSLAKNRTQLFDFAAGGLGAGAGVSMALFVAGLGASMHGGGAEAGLVPVPAALFQGSLLLGGAAKLAFGADALGRASVLVSPLLIGGWCGLVSAALNALPVGTLDGGRAAQAAFGRGPLAALSLLSYAGLGLGLLGSSLALPFGLFVLICQREAEPNVADEVSPVDARRRGIAVAIAVAALLILLPGLPDGDAVLGAGPGAFL